MKHHTRMATADAFTLPVHVEQAFNFLKDATNMCFSVGNGFWDSWEAFAWALDTSLRSGALIQDAWKAANRGDARAQFVVARLIKADLHECLNDLLITPHSLDGVCKGGDAHEVMHRLLKASAKQGNAPAIRECISEINGTTWLIAAVVNPPTPFLVSC